MFSVWLLNRIQTKCEESNQAKIKCLVNSILNSVKKFRLPNGKNRLEQSRTSLKKSLSFFFLPAPTLILNMAVPLINNSSCGGNTGLYLLATYTCKNASKINLTLRACNLKLKKIEVMYGHGEYSLKRCL